MQEKVWIICCALFDKHQPAVYSCSLKRQQQQQQQQQQQEASILCQLKKLALPVAFYTFTK
jgi:hypothetical protein